MRPGNKENEANTVLVFRDAGNDPGDPGPIKKPKLAFKNANVGLGRWLRG